MSYTSVILLNMGGPRNLAEVKPFLQAMFSDRRLIPLPLKPLLAPLLANLRAPITRRRYARIGGASPLNEIARVQAEHLALELNADGGEQYRVTCAMRYTKPAIGDVLRSAELRGARQIAVLSMYPQFCQATTGSSLEELKRICRREAELPPLCVIDRYFDDEGYLAAVEESVKQAMERAGRDPFVLFSAHGVPKKSVLDGDLYVEETRHTAMGVASRLGLREEAWQLSFQSRLGPIRWVAPRTQDALRSLAQRGVERIVIVPISFTTENLETLYDLDIILVPLAQRLGIARVIRAPALNTSPAFIRALARIVRSADESTAFGK